MEPEEIGFARHRVYIGFLYTLVKSNTSLFLDNCPVFSVVPKLRRCCLNKVIGRYCHLGCEQISFLAHPSERIRQRIPSEGATNAIRQYPWPRRMSFAKTNDLAQRNTSMNNIPCVQVGQSKPNITANLFPFHVRVKASVSIDIQ